MNDDIIFTQPIPSYPMPEIELSEDDNPEILDKEINDKIKAVINYEVVRKDETSVTLKINHFMFKKNIRIK